MINRSNEILSRVRAGVPAQRSCQPARSWIHQRAPRLRTFVRERQQRERTWAWLSLFTLIICWDASARLETRVSPPRARIAHAVERDEMIEQVRATEL
jgi:hypothetical protein